jgi:hypothetical protein
MGLPMTTVALLTSMWSESKVQPDLITLLEYCQIGQAIVVDFHVIPGHLQVLTGIVMYVMELLNEVSSLVSC